MSIVEVNKLDDIDLFPIAKGVEPRAKHFNAMRERMWVLEHPYAGSIDTTIAYGKWVGDATHFQYIDYNINNWHWLPDAKYHPGNPIVKYHWGPNANDVDIFIFKGTCLGIILNANPPVVGGVINNLWLLGTDPNKYSHWNFNAGRPDIQAEHRWRFVHHGWTEQDGWEFGLWETWKEYPLHTDPYEQIPHLKHDGITKARHFPVEKDRDDITQKLYTMYARKFQDSHIGTEPNITYWYHHFKPNLISEYVPGDSEPINSNQIGENIDYRDPKFNQSYQDRIQHCIEHNFNYVLEVDDFWIKNWQYWHYYGKEIEQVNNITGCPNTHPNYVNGAGPWYEYNPPYGMYYEGNSVLHISQGYFYRCIQDMPNASREPGVHADWEDYWIKDTLYQPNIFPSDPLYVQFSDILHRCNSSAFEKVLKNIGEYDWYWDPNATVSWYLYQQHYLSLTEHMGNPEGPGLEESIRKWPLPRGCWRRIWRYTQSWDTRRDPATGKYYRNQLSRFGKEIDINGKQVSMMWPGELGDPPGYDKILHYHGFENGTHYNFWWYQYVIDQATYDNMDRTEIPSWQYWIQYTVVDVEELFKQEYLSRPAIESQIAERHDPITTQWTTEYNKYTRLTEAIEEPIFELYADMINDMRDAIAELKYLSSPREKEVQQLWWYTNKLNFSSGLAAYQAGKQTELYNEPGGSIIYAGYRGFVAYMDTPGWQYMPWDITLPENSCYKAKVRITIISDIQNFPHTLAGTAMIRIKYRTLGTYSVTDWILEDCKIGFGGIVLEDERVPSASQQTLTWRMAFIGLEAKDFKWEWNSGLSKWEYKWESEVNLLEDWPPEEYFDIVMSHGWWRNWYRAMDLNFDIGNDLIFKLDFDGYPDLVIAEDKTNLIEV